MGSLDTAARRRLERFAGLFDHLDASTYATFADAGSSAEVDAAKDEAIRLLGSGPRREAVREAVQAFADEATLAYARRTSLPDTFMLFQSLPDRAEDRVRFLGSVERAVVALVLWDELRDDDRDALLGPWASIVGAA